MQMIKMCVLHIISGNQSANNIPKSHVPLLKVLLLHLLIGEILYFLMLIIFASSLTLRELSVLADPKKP